MFFTFLVGTIGSPTHSERVFSWLQPVIAWLSATKSDAFVALMGQLLYFPKVTNDESQVLRHDMNFLKCSEKTSTIPQRDSASWRWSFDMFVLQQQLNEPQVDIV